MLPLHFLCLLCFFPVSRSILIYSVSTARALGGINNAKKEKIGGLGGIVQTKDEVGNVFNVSVVLRNKNKMVGVGVSAVSYTHLTLPTRRTV